MPRFFASLAVANLLVLVGTAALGLWGHEAVGDRHVVLSVFALILSCLTQVLVFTYFTVTFKMMGQAIHLARRPLDPLLAAKELKRRLTRWLGLLVLSMIAVTATGALRWRTPDEGASHLILAGVTLALHVLVLFRQYELVVANAALVGEVLEEYGAARSGDAPQRGRPT